MECDEVRTTVLIAHESRGGRTRLVPRHARRLWDACTHAHISHDRAHSVFALNIGIHVAISVREATAGCVGALQRSDVQAALALVAKGRRLILDAAAVFDFASAFTARGRAVQDAACSRTGLDRLDRLGVGVSMLGAAVDLVDEVANQGARLRSAVLEVQDGRRGRLPLLVHGEPA